MLNQESAAAELTALGTTAGFGIVPLEEVKGIAFEDANFSGAADDISGALVDAPVEAVSVQILASNSVNRNLLSASLVL